MRKPCYGFFPGGDPREFRPDHDSCTHEELHAHTVACLVADVEDLLELWPSVAHTSSCRWLYDETGQVVRHLVLATFGLGTYFIDCCDECQEPACVCDLLAEQED